MVGRARRAGPGRDLTPATAVRLECSSVCVSAASVTQNSRHRCGSRRGNPRQRAAAPPLQSHVLSMHAPRDDWFDVPLDELCKHLVDHHHERTREYLSRARAVLTESIEARPGRADLVELARLLTVLEQDLSRHMVVEEMVLFPYIERLAAGGAVEQPSDGAVRVAQHDHENATSLLAGIRAIVAKLGDRDADLDRLCDSLDALDADLAEHSRLEDEVLFPRLDRLETNVARGSLRGTNHR